MFENRSRHGFLKSLISDAIQSDSFCISPCQFAYASAGGKAAFTDHGCPGAVFLNFSRDKLMDEGALIKALDADGTAPLGKISKYVTDFVTAGIHGRPDVIVLPHLGASTAEAEDNCAAMAARELMDYIENGNIVNSVNLPAVSLGPVTADETRVAVITKDEPDPVAAEFGERGVLQ